MIPIFSGKYLSDRRFISRMPSIILIVVLSLYYIHSIFSLQRLHRDILRKQQEISALTVVSNTIHSSYVSYTKESNILNEIKRRGITLIEIVSPPEIFKKEQYEE